MTDEHVCFDQVNGYFYHIIKKSIPADPDGDALDALLIANGYPKLSKCRPNLTSEKWIIFHGNKSNYLEAAFDDYLVTDAPAFMVETHDMDQDMAKQITRTTGADDTLGWVLP